MAKLGAAGAWLLIAPLCRFQVGKLLPDRRPVGVMR